jgi:hypothetical protein
LRLASFKLLVSQERARIVPATNDAGGAFVGPGVDLVGERARAAIALAQPMLEWLDAREPGVRVRSLSADLASGRVLVTVDDGGERPRVLRIDAPSSAELLDRAAPLVAFLIEEARSKIRARS